VTVVPSVVQQRRLKSSVLTLLIATKPIDTRADTVCGGKGWRVYELTEKVCDVRAYHESLPSMKDVLVATIVTACDDADGRTLILVAPQALFIGDTMDLSLIPPAQLQSHGLVVDTCLKQFSKGNHCMAFMCLKAISPFLFIRKVAFHTYPFVCQLMRRGTCLNGFG
jgi:hypothetical protein